MIMVTKGKTVMKGVVCNYQIITLICNKKHLSDPNLSLLLRDQIILHSTFCSDLTKKMTKRIFRFESFSIFLSKFEGENAEIASSLITGASLISRLSITLK